MHFTRTAYKSGGSAASARISYLTGQGAKDPTATSTKAPQKPDREDLIYARTKNLPAWAEGNPHTYFRAAERYERASPQNELRRGTAFEEWKIALPQELSQAKNKDLMRDIVDAVAGETIPITYVFHNPRTTDQTKQQPHLHLLISGRINDGHTRTPEQHFKRYNRAHPERGGAQKDPTFWHKGAVKAHRELLSDVINLHLEWAGVEGRVHPDSLRDRGIDRIPEPKLLPSESRAYREQGIISPRVQEVLDIRQERASLDAQEQAQAKTYWETRKTTLGITPGMSKNAQRKAVMGARAHRVTTPPVRQPIIGHRGSKIYHYPGQHNYGQVHPKQQVRFKTEAEAVQAGYRRARNDHYGRGSEVPRTPAPPREEHPLRTLAQRATTLLGRDAQSRGHWKLDIEIDPEVQEYGRG